MLYFIFILCICTLIGVSKCQQVFLDRFSKEERKGDWNCFVTIVVDIYGKDIPYDSINSIAPTRCHINFFYVVSHDIFYDDVKISDDEAHSYPYIIRTNYEDNGYLPFILSLLHNSTYVLVINDANFIGGYPDGVWIDDAIDRMRNAGNREVVITCAERMIHQYHSSASVADGCIFMESIKLRYIITKTEFRRNRIPPFIYFSFAFSCRFDTNIVEISYPTYHLIGNKRRFTLFECLSWFDKKKEDFSLQKINANCIVELHIQDVKCKSKYIGDKSIGIILSQYKRPYLIEQLPALIHSSVRIADIILFQNAAHMNYLSILNKYPMVHHIWSTNWNSPFFLRHLLPLLFLTSYHVVFDDDIIPGITTLEELIDNISLYDTVTGVGGRIVKTSDYSQGTYDMNCVDCRYQIAVQSVDYVIQVYAKKSLYSKIFWRYRPFSHRNGDDMHGSLSYFMECGKRGKRPPLHNSSRYLNYGSDSVASFFTPAHSVVRAQTFRNWVVAGYQPFKTDFEYKSYGNLTPLWKTEFAKENNKYF